MELPRSSSGVSYWPERTSTGEPSAGAQRGLLGRALIFVLLFAALSAVYERARGTVVERLFIEHATVQVAAWLIDSLDPAVEVEASGSRLRAPGGGLNVLNGCEGAEVMFLLLCAMAVAPVRWRQRAAGVLLGMGLVFALNQVRIVALFYSFRADKAMFDLLHGLIAPLLMIAAVAAFFLAWLHYCDTPRRAR